MASACFITLSRSDYASTRPVIRAALDAGVNVQLIAGGSHMLARFGRTINHITADGFTITDTVDFLREHDNTDAELAAAYARAVDGFVRCFTTHAPDRVFILGDRWEMLAVATAASMLRIPILHHSGGDITQGSSDNQTRYALSVLAHIHLTALEEHSQRLIAMGEEPWRVITTGEPALTELSQHTNYADIRTRFGISAGAPFALATFHPTSYEACPPAEQVRIFLQALAQVDMPIILTAPNPDAGSDDVWKALEAFCAPRPQVHLVESLGTDYYAAMAQSQIMIGNSSSALWEAPSFALPAVNIGERQRGRVAGDNVVHAPLDVAAITAAIATARSDAFRAGLSGTNPYVMPDTLARIIAAIRTDVARPTLLAKQLIDPLGQ